MSDVDEKPQPPGDYECCESGCSVCVWDVYFEALRAWQEEQVRRLAEKASAE